MRILGVAKESSRTQSELMAGKEGTAGLSCGPCGQAQAEMCAAVRVASRSFRPAPLATQDVCASRYWLVFPPP